jgi:hypothetical protein
MVIKVFMNVIVNCVDINKDEVKLTLFFIGHSIQ